MTKRTSARHLGAVLALLLCACAPLQAATPAQPQPLPAIENFFANPALSDARLSPNARYLAAISGKADRRDFLVVAGYDNVDIRQFQWVNNDRLVFDVTDKQVAIGGQFKAAGLYAVNRDGGNLCQPANRLGGPASETDSRIRRIETDAAGTVWFDPAIKAAQDKLDAALPGTINLMSFSSGVDQEWTLVKVFSDTRPLPTPSSM